MNELNLKKFKLTIEKVFIREMSSLNKECYPQVVNSDGSEKDEFDDISYFIVIREIEKIIAYGRLTPGPNSVFHKWSKGLCEIPNSASSIDLGRCMVHPDYRGYDFLKVICIAGFLYAKEIGYTYINGAARPGRGLINMLEQIGYKQCGHITDAHFPDGSIVPLHLFTANLTTNEVNLELMLNEVCESLLSRGIEIQIDLV